MEMTFIRVEWPGCPSIEISGKGDLKVDGEEVTAEEFTLALARAAQAWSDSVADPPGSATHLTAYLLRGPLPYWTGEVTCGDRPSSS